MVYLVLIIIVLFDQWFKILIERGFNPGQSIPVIEDYFHLTYVRNTGAAFGLFQDNNFILIVFSMLVIVFFIFFIKYQAPDSIAAKISTGLIIGGALGNIIDRIRLGFVIDYLDFQVWPVFNLADTAIVIGAIMLIIVFLRE